jgi:hypothetical protein
VNYIEIVPLVNRWTCSDACRKHATYAIREMRTLDRPPGLEMLSVKEFCNAHAWEHGAALVEKLERRLL